ncbi:MAG: hypothetical protein SGI72_11350 [Planctomycetota bacterium]|nr:hypothetical protein [Planctomycetota bacterium]
MFLSKHLASLAAVVAFTLGAEAQTNFPFTLDQANSNFTFSGTSTLGPIVGNPSNMFQLLGGQNVDLTFQSGAQPFATSAFTTGGVVSTNGALHAKVTGAFGITLATIDITGLTMEASSPSFSVGGGGAFTASLTLTALSGTMLVTPLIGTPSNTSLAGNTGAPTPVNGTLTRTGANFHLVAPVSSVFAFADPGTGASGSITLVGTITADHTFMKSFCIGDGSGTACPCANNSPAGQGRGCVHSGGVGARLLPSGVPSLSNDTLVLTGASQLPGTLGLYFQGTMQAGGGAGISFGDGLLCASGAITRLGVKAAPGGSSSYPVVGDPSVSVAGLVAGAPTVRTYQLWYRDAAVYCTASTNNLTNGVQVQWMP